MTVPLMNNRRPRRGFTIAELMVVIGIMLLVTMMTIPVIGPMLEGRAATAGIQQIEAAIYRARILAASHNKTYYLSFNNADLYNNMVVLYNGGEIVGAPLVLPENARLKRLTTTMEGYDLLDRDMDGVLDDPDTLSENDDLLSVDDFKLSFDPMGQIRVAGHDGLENDWQSHPNPEDYTDIAITVCEIGEPEMQRTIDVHLFSGEIAPRAHE